jgi:nucleotide-binding universal stress UspA family protein
VSQCKSILVHLKSYQDWTPSIDTAIALAKRFDAKLTGLYTIRELAMIKLVLGTDHRAVGDAEARDAPLTEAMRTKFMDACARAGIDARFDIGEGNANELLSFAGRCHDLVVIEQSSVGLDGLGADTAEECAVACGIPTLMVPKSGDYAGIGRCIAIGWNHSRQSAAALHGALALIGKADRVVVLQGAERDPMPSVTKRPQADIAAYLKLHAGNVTVARIAESGKGSGVDLQSAALEAGADLLVMGAYGRSAWREFVFGGTTREVMQELRLPVLMAH